MKPRHTATLALLGWYLLVPPWTTGMPDHRAQRMLTHSPLHGNPLGIGNPDAKAPLSKWRIVVSFDTAQECEKARTHRTAHRDEEYAQYLRLDVPDQLATYMSHARCVETDDPRLAK